jgi:hypothetical protein
MPPVRAKNSHISTRSFRASRNSAYVEDRNIMFEHRFPNEIPEPFRQMAAELAALNVATIVTVGNQSRRPRRSRLSLYS